MVILNGNKIYLIAFAFLQEVLFFSKMELVKVWNLTLNLDFEKSLSRINLPIIEQLE